MFCLYVACVHALWVYIYMFVDCSYYAVCLFVCLFARLFVCLSVFSCVCLFICSFVRLFVCPFVRLFVCSFVCLFVCVRLCVCFFGWLVVRNKAAQNTHCKGKRRGISMSQRELEKKTNRIPPLSFEFLLFRLQSRPLRFRLRKKNPSEESQRLFRRS